MTATLQRTLFETSRAAEYVDARELQAQTGQPRSRFAAVVLKELVDNGLDATEAPGVAPCLTLEAEHHPDAGLLFLTVGDNGAGLPPETLQRVLNFGTRASDKAAYRAPTRGAQGNALKTVLGIPYALGLSEPVVIEACGERHSIRAWTDPAGEVRVLPTQEAVPAAPGTRVTLAVPLSGQEWGLEHWGRAFALFNPHASVRIRETLRSGERAYSEGDGEGKSYRPSLVFPGGWRKFLPTDLTSPWWYDAAALSRLVFSHVRAARDGGRDLPLREFVMQFRGLSGTAKARQVCERLTGLSHLSGFDGQEGRVGELLAAMQEVTGKPASPDVLGSVGEAHLRDSLDAWYGVKRHWYRKVTGLVEGVPFAFEALLAETRQAGSLFHGVNFSQTFEDPLGGIGLRTEKVTGYGAHGFLEAAHAAPDGTWESPVPTAAAVHLVCLALEFLDGGRRACACRPRWSKRSRRRCGR